MTAANMEAIALVSFMVMTPFSSKVANVATKETP
jgi:hypothetical protein